MKSFPIRTFSNTGAVALFVLFTLLATSAHATSFNWSYEFGDGTVASGMLEGDIALYDSNTVNITDIIGTWTWTGDAMWGVDILAALGTHRITFDGSLLNFGARGPDGALITFAIRPGRNSVVLRELGGAGFIVDSPIIADRWSLTPKTIDTPPTSALLLIGGIGMLGLLAWAHRKKTSAAI